MLEYEEFAGLFGPWAEKFKPFILSKEMFEIYQTLKAEKEIIVPKSENVFKGFSNVNPKDVKVIFYLMDPYPRRYKDKTNQATGIAMDCSNSPDGTIQPSLKLFYSEIEKHLGKKIEKDCSLKYLMDQGVMFLNTDLTCKLNKTNSHDKLWEPFQKYFLEEVMAGTTGIVYVLAGKVSHRMEKFINPLGNHIIKVEHPTAAARSEREWNSEGLFKKIDRLSGKIYWSKEDWQAINEPPF